MRKAGKMKPTTRPIPGTTLSTSPPMFPAFLIQGGTDKNPTQLLRKAPKTHPNHTQNWTRKTPKQPNSSAFKPSPSLTPDKCETCNQRNYPGHVRFASTSMVLAPPYPGDPPSRMGNRKPRPHGGLCNPNGHVRTAFCSCPKAGATGKQTAQLPESKRSTANNALTYEICRI